MLTPTREELIEDAVKFIQRISADGPNVWTQRGAQVWLTKHMFPTGRPTTEGVTTLDVLSEVVQERARQDEKHGGPEHDDTHSFIDWSRFIDKRVNVLLSAIHYGDEDKRQALIEIAALAIAAIESHDRIHAQPPEVEIVPEFDVEVVCNTCGAIVGDAKCHTWWHGTPPTYIQLRVPAVTDPTTKNQELTDG